MIPSRQRNLTLALLLSLLLHLTIVIGPGWVLPTSDDLQDIEPSTQLDARLTTPSVRKTSSHAAPPPAGSKSRRNVTPIPSQPLSPRDEQPVTPIDEQPVGPLAGLPPARQDPQRETASTDSNPAKLTPAMPIEPAAPESPWPRHGRIRFVVTRGDQGFVIGQSVHRWSHDGKTYTLKNVTETTGIAALFRPVQVTQTSTGNISAEGLRPREFRTEKNGVAGDAAVFDWTSLTLMLSAGSPHAVVLRPGAQDMLSMFYQLSARYPRVPRGINEVMVATGRKFERYAFETFTEELLRTRYGELRTLHLRAAAGVEAIDIWLGLDLRGLPVKIRYTDREGESFDQTADEIEFDGMQTPGGKP